jgi:hypothetical protein
VKLQDSQFENYLYEADEITKQFEAISAIE